MSPNKLAAFAMTVALGFTPAFSADAPKKAVVKDEKPAKEETPKKSRVEWSQTATLTGTISNTTIVGNNGGGGRNTNGKSGYGESYVKPEYKEFSVSGPAFKITWDVSPSEKRGDIRAMLQKEVERGNKKDWRRVSAVGPIRLNQKGEALFTTGPGSYRLEMTGMTVKYSFVVEEAQKAAN